MPSEILGMAQTKYGIPPEVEQRLRARDTHCVYCHKPMKAYPHKKGAPDKATIEHLNYNGPSRWKDGVKGVREEDLVICCGSCNSSRGDLKLYTWFESSYCRDREVPINEDTVAEPVRAYLKREGPRNREAKLPPIIEGILEKAEHVLEGVLARLDPPRKRKPRTKDKPQKS